MATDKNDTSPMVWLVMYEHDANDGTIGMRILGIYSSEEESDAALDRFSMTPLHKGPGSSYSIGAFRLDTDRWASGAIYEYRLVGKQ